MDALDVARLQFGVTTVYHFMFVPLTIGLAPLVAILQTMWYRTGQARYYRLTQFFGKLLLINFAIGVVTGIVQEFQFGMNWSEYSRFVGDVFGAPLAIEGLAAFFVESTFLGLWIFGWDRLPRAIHLATIWAVAVATWASAYFILAANSFMQHPVGVRFNPETGRAELTSIWELMTNVTTLAAFPHVVAGSVLTGATFMAAIATWWMVRSARRGDLAEARVYRPAAILGLWTILVSGVAVTVTGDWQAKLMFEQQPMKMAAAEALCDTETGAGFSIIAVGDLQNRCDVRQLTVPGLTSFMATGDPDATLKGVRDLQEEYTERYGDNGSYVPILPVTYWSFRLMIGFGVVSALLALAGLWLTRRGRVPDDERLGRWALWAVPAPFLANTVGWIFTEMGRQPWVVAPNPTGIDGVWMLTRDGVSGHDAWVVWVSLIAFTVIYGALAVIWFGLMRRYAAHGAPVEDPPPEHLDEGDESEPLHFAY